MTSTFFSRTSLGRLAAAGIAACVISADSAAQSSRFIRPIDGTLVLAGPGPVPDCVLDGFLHQCGAPAAEVVVLAARSGPAVTADRWRDRGAGAVRILKRPLRSTEQTVLLLLRADGVWLEEVANAYFTDAVFGPLLRDVLARGGVVGGVGAGARALDAGVDEKPRGFGLLPQSVVRPRTDGAAAEDDGEELAAGLVEWGLASSTALVVHHGRRVFALGNGNVVVRVAANGGWPERRRVLRAIDVFEFGDEPSYQLDLLAWLRSARDRLGPVFPPEVAPRPDVEKGTLILHGGRGVDDATFELFVDAAGGDDARIVCIPSASAVDDGDEANSYSAERLRSRGCSNVVVLHNADPEVADRDPRFLAAIERASGVWIDGGRTFRAMDALEGTRVHRALFDVLARGGVVGGSSAGCQVAGDFLVRGNPRTNRDLEFAGYTRGLGLLPGVILDAHFLQRDRAEPFAELMRRHGQMLGIGVDEKTAIVVRRSVAEVVGANAVSFYTRGGDDTQEVVVLRAGDRFDLAKRVKR